MKSIKITIPNVPMSVNCMYRTYKGRVILSRRGREYKSETKKYIDNYIESMDDFEPIEGRVKIELDICFRDKRKRDLDNYVKSVIDSIKNKLFGDDDLIFELNVRKHIQSEKNETIIEITKI